MCGCLALSEDDEDKCVVVAKRSLVRAYPSMSAIPLVCQAELPASAEGGGEMAAARLTSSLRNLTTNNMYLDDIQCRR